MQDGKVGVVTVFCHDWLYGLCREVAEDRAMSVPTPFEDYLRTGRIRVAGTNSFQLDVFANVREMAANFYPIDHLIAKVLLIAELREDATLVSQIAGHACASCGAFVPPQAVSCPACGKIV